MPSPSLFSSADLIYLAELGISAEQVIQQIRILAKPLTYLALDRPGTLNDGIKTISENEVSVLLDLHRQAAGARRCLKFVPASGAATRMFQALLWYMQSDPPLSYRELQNLANDGDRKSAELIVFAERLHEFAFFDDFAALIKKHDHELSQIIKQDDLRTLCETITAPAGLNYGNLPKGLIKFHRYPEETRTAFEEHLLEAINCFSDRENRCRAHFTVQAAYRRAFSELAERLQKKYEQKSDAKLEVGFSEQERATDTIAVDLDQQLCRSDDGKILFRPGGHGALLRNLYNLQGDLIFIKNIDNVPHDRSKAIVYLWNKILGGYTVRLQNRIFRYLELLLRGAVKADILQEIWLFIKQELSFKPSPAVFDEAPARQQDRLIHYLNRPLMVAGVVKNVGEPGGGPFWIQENDGASSLQIVEYSQLNPDAPETKAIWQRATHFNPVNIVAAVRDYQGRPFDLRLFSNPETSIITVKTHAGKKIKVLELPGLWNGAMYYWNKAFINIPLEVFNPVKTVNDLLRPEHAP